MAAATSRPGAHVGEFGELPVPGHPLSAAVTNIDAEPPFGPVTGPPNSERPVVFVPSEPGDAPEGSAVQEILLEGHSSRADDEQGFSSLLTWLITSTKPNLVVEVGPRDATMLQSATDALAGTKGRYVVVPMPGRADAYQFGHVLDDPVGIGLERHDAEADALSALASGPAIDLFHVALLEDDATQPDLRAWFDVMCPGSIIVITTFGDGESTGFKRAKNAISSDRFHMVQVTLGPDRHALVAQMPHQGRAAIVEALAPAGSATTALSLVGGDRAGAGEPLDSSGSPTETGMSPALTERQLAERAAYLAALRMYQQLTALLREDLTAVKSELSAQREGARLERESLITEFLDRLDVLSAKISTSASKYSAELADKDRRIEDVEKKMHAYAGLATNAQNVIDDIHRSSSWRLTAPVRLFSRIMKRAAARRSGA
jgi:hypothetical protein